MGGRWDYGISKSLWWWCVVNPRSLDVYVLFCRATKPSRHRESPIQCVNHPHHQVAGEHVQQNRTLRLRTHQTHTHFPERGGRGGWKPFFNVCACQEAAFMTCCQISHWIKNLWIICVSTHFHVLFEVLNRKRLMESAHFWRMFSKWWFSPISKKDLMRL